MKTIKSKTRKLMSIVFVFVPLKNFVLFYPRNVEKQQKDIDNILGDIR